METKPRVMSESERLHTEELKRILRNAAARARGSVLSLVLEQLNQVEQKLKGAKNEFMEKGFKSIGRR
jgi:hypothetical protein